MGTSQTTEPLPEMPAELGPTKDAKRYAATLESVSELDRVLFGLGEDGHTGSLFPGHDVGHCADAPSVLAVLDAPKPPPHRVTMSARRLQPNEKNHLHCHRRRKARGRAAMARRKMPFRMRDHTENGCRCFRWRSHPAELLTFAQPSQPPPKPAARRPATSGWHVRIKAQIRPLRWFSIMSTVGPSLIPK